MNRKLMLLMVLFLILTLFVGCGAQSKDAFNESIAFDSASGKAGQSTAPQEEAEQGADEDAASSFVQRKIIKNASLSLEVDMLEEKVKAIEQQIDQFNGYLEESSINRSNTDNLWAEMVLRIPSLEFEKFMDTLENIGVVKNRRIYRDDVTAKFVDMEARLRVLKTEEQSLLNLLEKAVAIEDLLSIRKELRILRSDIEAIEGELKYFTNQVDYSTISLYITQTKNSQTRIDAKGLAGIWQKGLFAFTKNINALISFIGSFIGELIK
jgi:hypothetical protein